MAVTDPNWNYRKDYLGPGYKFAAITKSDTVDIPLTRAVYVGGAGNVVAVDADGTQTTFSAVPAGTWLPIAVRRIDSTNTTATLMVAIY